MRKVIRITDIQGDLVPLNNLVFWYVGIDYAHAYIKDTGFSMLFSSANCYTVETEEV